VNISIILYRQASWMRLLSVFPIKVPEDENLRLVAITLMIAESRPEEKDIMVNLVMNFLTM